MQYKTAVPRLYKLASSNNIFKQLIDPKVWPFWQQLVNAGTPQARRTAASRLNDLMDILTIYPGHNLHRLLADQNASPMQVAMAKKIIAGKLFKPDVYAIPNVYNKGEILGTLKRVKKGPLILLNMMDNYNLGQMGRNFADGRPNYGLIMTLPGYFLHSLIGKPSRVVTGSEHTYSNGIKTSSSLYNVYGDNLKLAQPVLDLMSGHNKKLGDKPYIRISTHPMHYKYGKGTSFNSPGDRLSAVYLLIDPGLFNGLGLLQGVNDLAKVNNINRRIKINKQDYDNIGRLSLVNPVNFELNTGV